MIQFQIEQEISEKKKANLDKICEEINSSLIEISQNTGRRKGLS